MISIPSPDLFTRIGSHVGHRIRATMHDGVAVIYCVACMETIIGPIEPETNDEHDER